MNRLFKKTVRVTAWRESIAKDPTEFNTERLALNETFEITELRVKFKVERSLSKTPNACDINIFNLSAASRANLELTPLSVQLEAGYDDVPRLLFLGDLRFGMSELSGSEWNTLLQLGDGDRTYSCARVNRSYKPGTTYRTVLKDAARSMGFELPKQLESDSTLDTQFVSGTVSHGPTRDELTRLLAPFGYHWSIQNGDLTVLKDDEVSSLTALPIDEEHGMIGTPVFGSPPKSGKPPHINVKMLIYPELVPGDLIKLTSKAKNGIFRIEKVRHSGDTHGNEWFTEVEIKPY